MATDRRPVSRSERGPVVCHSVSVSGPTAQDLYREMMNRAITPLMKAAGFKRKTQVFEKDLNDRKARVEFQKNRYNTKHHVSFTINLAVVSPRALEEHLRARLGAITYWGRDVVVIPTGGQWVGRIGAFLGTGDFRTREEMDDAARSVVSALRDRALPLIERELHRPITFPSYVIETEGSPCGTHVNEAGEIVYHNVGGKRLWPVPEGTEPERRAPGGPDLRTPPHTWPSDGGPPGLVTWLK